MGSCKCGPSFASLANNRITIQNKAMIDDGAGGQSVSWNDMITVWAIIEPTVGREIYSNSQKQSRVDAKITIRYQSLFQDTRDTAAYRIQFGNRLYGIVASKNVGEDMKTENYDYNVLYCVEGVPS